MVRKRPRPFAIVLLLTILQHVICLSFTPQKNVIYFTCVIDKCFFVWSSCFDTGNIVLYVYFICDSKYNMLELFYRCIYHVRFASQRGRNLFSHWLALC
jgi:hypothetical protein